MMRLLFLILGFFLLAACNQSSQKETLASKQTGPHQTNVRERLAPLENAVASSDGTGRFEVLLVPERPYTDDSLQAQARGCAKALTFSWSVNGTPLEGRTRSSLPPSFYAKGDVVTVSGECEGASLEVSRRIENSLPRVQSAEFIGQNFGTGIPLEVTASGADIDGDELSFSYRWQVNGEVLVGEDGAVLAGEYVLKGQTILLTVIPLDDEGEGESLEGVPFVVPNLPPKFVSEPPAAFQAEVYTYQPVTTDPDGDLVTYSLAASPPGMLIDPATGSIRWPISSQSGSYDVTIVATDQDGMDARQSYSINLN